MEITSNSTQTSSLDDSDPWSATDYVIMVCIILQPIIIILSIIGNSLVISNVCSSTKQTAFTRAKLSLAISDLGCSAAAMLSVIYTCMASYMVYRPWLETRIFEIASCMGLFFFVASVNSLAIMALQRFYAIKEPLKYMHLSTQKQLISITVAWISSFILLVLYLIYFLGDINFITKTVFNSLFLFACMLIPFAILIISTIAMLVVFLYDKNRNTINEVGVIVSRKDHERMVKITMFMVFGYFITCGPFMATFLIVYLRVVNSTAQFRTSIVQMISDTLVLFTNLIDIVAYSLFDEHFRNYVKEVLYFKLFKRNQG